ncbi:hypothetical protein BDP81DRAFT_394903 [Colletotrichum phormii]|uniref:Uncharacterized protein n=1 Tax=Colletotrichum phormii TaxID=359342 RepID=A0AAI9ZR25_9PEZI|nr:uncharacterized protein BDP81DRAFT_394903 [Colletotrichum phormii]KAK1636291.1 hypothetical protein BDP81DRAFT_394903 [Colletotrichum phormii]
MLLSNQEPLPNPESIGCNQVSVIVSASPPLPPRLPVAGQQPSPRGCGLYCLALDQSVKDLQDCLFEQGAGYTDVFCRDNGNVNASATATGNVDPPASAKASVVASGGSGSGSGGGSSSASGSGSSSSSTSSANAAAAGVHVPAGVNTLGLTIGALLLSAATFGALQI